MRQARKNGIFGKIEIHLYPFSSDEPDLFELRSGSLRSQLLNQFLSIRYFGLIFVILLPWSPSPAISPFWLKINA